MNTLPQETQLLTFALLTTPSWMDGASSNSHVPPVLAFPANTYMSLAKGEVRRAGLSSHLTDTEA